MNEPAPLMDLDDNGMMTDPDGQPACPVCYGETCPGPIAQHWHEPLDSQLRPAWVRARRSI